MSVDSLHVSADVNVLLDAAIPWAADPHPIEVRFDDGSWCSGSPAATLLLTIASGTLVNGQRMVLHSSRRALALCHQKLIEEYRWDKQSAGDWIRVILGVVRDSGGRWDHGSEPLQTVCDDAEDNHRFSEAANAGAEVLFTSDRNFLAASDVTRRPLMMSPRDFMSRIGATESGQ